MIYDEIMLSDNEAQIVETRLFELLLKNRVRDWQHSLHAMEQFKSESGEDFDLHWEQASIFDSFQSIENSLEWDREDESINYVRS